MRPGQEVTIQYIGRPEFGWRSLEVVGLLHGMSMLKMLKMGPGVGKSGWFQMFQLDFR
jgi:hypothetical protein